MSEIGIKWRKQCAAVGEIVLLALLLLLLLLLLPPPPPPLLICDQQQPLARPVASAGERGVGRVWSGGQSA